MRRIPRLRHSAVFTQCLQSTVSAPAHAAVSRAAAATSCLGGPRDFSTTPNRTLHRSQAWADNSKTRGTVVEELTEIQEEGDHAAVSLSPSRTGSNLVLPPSERTVAPRLDDLSSDYQPAETADTLEVVGGLEGWFAEDKNHYGVPKYVGFAPLYDKDAPPALMELYAVRAVLEAVAVATFVKNLPPTAVKRRKKSSRSPANLLAAKWRDGGREGLDRALQMRWTVDKDGNVEVSEGHEAILQELRVDSEDAAAVSDGSIAAEEAQEILKTLDQRWKRISLADSSLKFAVAKRVYQLTGRAIPDAKLLQVETAGQLLALVVKPPPPRTVYEAVQQRGELTKLPNVQVVPKRVTPVDKARARGSWKIIEEELKKRDLPVLGPDRVDKFVEPEWFRGPRPAKKDKKKRRVH